MNDMPNDAPNEKEAKKSLASIIDLTTRIDERVQGVVRHQKELEQKLEKINDLNARIKVLESSNVADRTFGTEDRRITSEIKNDLHNMDLRMNVLEKSSTSQELRWKAIFGFGVQLIWVILSAYMLYKLGIQSPPVP